MSETTQNNPETGRSEGPRRSRKSFGLIASLAWADLRHEKILSVCLVLALSAVLSPLLILFGLKFGTIEVLRGRLIEDPRNREIRPLTSRSYERDWFKEIAARPDVAFVVPLTRKIAAGVSASVVGGDRTADLDLMPTKEGDRLITENGSAVPGEGECVLSAGAAEKLGAAIGDRILLRASRVVGAEREVGEAEFRCSGVVSLRATGLPTLYVQLPVLDAVERFKDGQAVPEMGWPGTLPKAFPVYDGAVLVLSEVLSREDELELVVTTGFTKIGRLEKEAYGEHGIETGPPEGGAAYLLSTMSSGVEANALSNLAKRVPGVVGAPLPWVRSIGVRLEDGKTLSVSIGGGAEKGRGVIVPSGLGLEKGATVSMSLGTEGEEALRFPVTVEGVRGGGEEDVLVSAELGGILRLARERVVTFEPGAGNFLVTRRGYAGFRLYARTIDEVDGLRRFFEDQGIESATEAERIRDVLELDLYLSYVFWMIAGVGLLGSMAALVASLYAAVERKRRPLSVLRLIGLRRRELVRFPVYQGLTLVLFALVASYGFFRLVAETINTYFGQFLEAGENLCRLPLFEAVAAAVLCLGLAGAASLAAAMRIAFIEPGEGLRDE